MRDGQDKSGIWTMFEDFIEYACFHFRHHTVSLLITTPGLPLKPSMLRG